jgi:hypothetical protein
MCENRRRHGGNAERDDGPRVRPHRPEQTIVCADSEQVIRDADYARFRPPRGGAAPAHSSADEAPRIVLGNRLGAGPIPRPIHLTDEVRQDRIRAAAVEEEHLAQVRLRDPTQQDLQEPSWSPVVDQVAGRKGLDDDVPQPPSRNCCKRARRQREAEQTLRRHP